VVISRGIINQGSSKEERLDGDGVKFQCHCRSCGELFGFLTAFWLYVERLMGSVVTGQHYARRIPIRLRVGLISLLAMLIAR
jgi:hypothetical protein